MTGMAQSLSSALLSVKLAPPRGRESQTDKSLGELEGRVHVKARCGLPAASDQGPICLEIKTKYCECPGISTAAGITEVT